MKHTCSIIIAAPIEAVFAFHEDPANLPRITPPGIDVTILDVQGKGRGMRVLMRMRQLGVLSNTLLMEFVEYESPRRLADVQIRGPFKLWHQVRSFREVPGGTELSDQVEYEIPGGPLGALIDRMAVAPRIRRMFEYRQRRTRELIEREHYRQSGD